MTSPMCPWCGDELDDTPEQIPFPDDADVTEIDCGGCGQPVRLLRVVTMTYLAEKRQGGSD
jgi:hypothetical protein